MAPANLIWDASRVVPWDGGDAQGRRLENSAL